MGKAEEYMDLPWATPLLHNYEPHQPTATQASRSIRVELSSPPDVFGGTCAACAPACQRLFHVMLPMIASGHLNWICSNRFLHSTCL